MTDRLAELESTVQQGLATFIEVGDALLEIRKDKLYKARGYYSFADYMQRRWHFSRTRGYQLTAVAIFVQKVSKILDISVLPPNEEQTRNLQRALANVPEEVGLMMLQAAASIAKDVSPDGKITTPVINALKDVLAGIMTTGALDDTEGGQIALSEAFTAQVTEDMRERLIRNRAYVLDALARKHGAAVKAFETEITSYTDLLGKIPLDNDFYAHRYRIVFYKLEEDKNGVEFRPDH